jgi:hypothetical protein
MSTAIILAAIISRELATALSATPGALGIPRSEHSSQFSASKLTRSVLPSARWMTRHQSGSWNSGPVPLQAGRSFPPGRIIAGPPQAPLRSRHQAAPASCRRLHDLSKTSLTRRC